MEVLLDGEQVQIPAGHCQVLLATLLLRANEFVSAQELTERLWPAERPAKQALHVVVRRLRRALGDANCVYTRTGGYEATVDQDQLDLLRFRALAGTGDFGAAMSLWRNSVLGDVVSTPLHRDDVPMLAEERLAVLERRIGADLARGLGGELVAELRQLTEDHPVREEFWRFLMLALHRSGQRDEALAAYKEISDRLGAEAGIEPGPALQAAREKIERGAASRRQVPRQLPASLRTFVGRDQELATLGELGPVTVLHGAGGVGKTALALYWAHEFRHEFPDGDLYTNLRGFDPETSPADPAVVAQTLLVGLGVQEIPIDAKSRYALLRAELADRKALLVLDNAVSARQVLPLLPKARDVRVVITSRNQLRGLVTQNEATAIGLRQLDDVDGHALLVAVLGQDRITAEPEAVSAIIERCAGLPLALRVFAERVAQFPGTPLRDFVAELDQARLDVLSDYEDAGVRAVFSWSYRRLDEESARMFRLLSVHPGADFDLGAAAAIVGVNLARAHRMLERLVADHLVQSSSPGRYVLHDLLRAYAAELCGNDEGAAYRMTEWYVHTLANASKPRNGKEPPVSVGAITSGIKPQEFATWFDTLAWRRQEWDNLRAVMFAAITRGWQRQALLIPLFLHGYLIVQPERKSEAVAMFEAVQNFGDRREQAHLRLHMASIYEENGLLDRALRTYQAAIPVVREVGERATEAVALINLGVVYRKLEDPEGSLSCSRQALAIALEIGERYYELAARANIAGELQQMERHAEALPDSEQAVAAARELGDEYLTARVSTIHGQVLNGLGRFEEAERTLRWCIDVTHKYGGTLHEADALSGLAHSLSGMGRSEEAVATWQRSLELARGLHDELTEHVEKMLALARGPAAG